MHADQVIDRLRSDGLPAPERVGGFFKCPRCTFTNDDVDEMADHIRKACDLAYNDDGGTPMRKESGNG